MSEDSLQRGAQLLRNGQTEAAVAALREAVAADPGSFDARLHLGVALARAGDQEGAIRELRAALSIDPSSAPAHYNLGTILQTQGQLAAAAEAYNEALRIDPAHENARAAIGALRPHLAAAPPPMPGPTSPAKKGPNVALIVGLVVLGCVVVVGLGLAAILMPVFAKAREKARQTSCLSNVKQLALATLMYSSDYDECLPLTEWPGEAAPATDVDESSPVSSGEIHTWASAIYPYTRNAGLFVCPSWSAEVTSDALGAQMVPPTPLRFSYSPLEGDQIHDGLMPGDAPCGVCGRTCPVNQPAWNAAGQPQSVRDISPANTIMLVELKIGDPRGTGSEFDAWHTRWPAKYGPPQGADKHVHNAGSNYAFHDGHAKWMRQPDVGMFTVSREDNL
ncbi:MAG: tetratricopeptide repeat protein [Armatimonadota bacterium]